MSAAANGGDPGTPPAPKKESKVEIAKRQSGHLRGRIEETLASDAARFADDDVQVLKFHGIYQQDDRDVRKERRAAGELPAYSFMVRVALPGGALTAEQYLALDELADDYANGTIRITTRQGIQFHGVLKDNLKSTLAGLNDKLMTTIAACGDIERNVMAGPAPLADGAHQQVQAVAQEIARELRPATNAYHEIWLGDEKVATSQEKEPFYGESYLPRKFKTGVTLASDNSIDVYSYDCGLLAVVKNGAISAYNVVVGGGMGMNHNRPDTFVAVAQHLGSIAPERAIETVRTVVAIFRDHGNRGDRKHARLKYLLDEWGINQLRAEFRNRVEFDLKDWIDVPPPSYEDYLGPHEQRDGRWFYGVFVQNGRIMDRDGHSQRSALREIVQAVGPTIRLTANQNALLCDLQRSDIATIESLLPQHGVAIPTTLSNARRFSMACPALPTCGLALTESERVFTRVVADFEKALEDIGLADEELTIRMTGCPNGCARPYTADLGFVGRKPGEQYNIYVGGGLSGTRLADLYAEDVHINELVATVEPLLRHFAKHRSSGESFSQHYQRLMGQQETRQKLTGKETPTRKAVELKVLA